MVTMQRLGKVKIEVRSDHLPPHFHITSPDSAFMVDLYSFQVLRGHGRADELEWAVEWAKAHAVELQAKWKEIND